MAIAQRNAIWKHTRKRTQNSVHLEQNESEWIVSYHIGSFSFYRSRSCSRILISTLNSFQKHSKNNYNPFFYTGCCFFLAEQMTSFSGSMCFMVLWMHTFEYHSYNGFLYFYNGPTLNYFRWYFFLFFFFISLFLFGGSYFW